MAKSKRKVSKFSVLGVVTVLILLADQWTKHLILGKFQLGESWVGVHQYFSITYVQNKGAAFGILSQASPEFRVPFFVVIPLVALSSLLYVFNKLGDRDSKMALALSLIISGAIGNLIDRFTLGFVVDFLDFHWQWKYHFPAFNVADSAICIGVAILMWDLLKLESQLPRYSKSVSATSKKGT